MDSKLLSQEEALDFLQNVLKVNQEDFENKTGLCFLNTIIERFFEEVPFQNLYVLQNARIPSFEEIKTNMYNRVGGLCFELNLYMGQLLQALGYSVNMVCGFENSGEESLHHAFIVAENVGAEGHTYCVDVGFGYPMFFAVPIHGLVEGDQETPAYSLGYWQFRFTKEAGDRYSLQSYDEGRRRPPDVVEFVDNVELPKNPSWLEEYTFCLKPLSYAEAVEVMEPVYSLPLESYFLVNFHCVTFKGKLAFGYKNKAFLRECSERHVLKPQRIFTRFPDLQESILKHFPQFDDEIVEAALKNLEINQMNAPHLIAKTKSRKLSICQETAIYSCAAGLNQA